jgi:hypothetical protein
MQRAYIVLRVLAYVLGTAGAALAYFGRAVEPALQKKLFGIGAGLMLVMFLIFLVSYGLYLFMKFGASFRS